MNKMITNSEHYKLVERKKAVFVEIQILQEELNPLLDQLHCLKKELIQVTFALGKANAEREELDNMESADIFFTRLESNFINSKMRVN